jgi:2'-5' RNA ligase
MPRLFIGIKCTELNYLSTLQSELKNILSKSKVNWVDPAIFHITIKFLGDVEESLIETLISVLNNISKQFKPATLIPGKVGTFGDKQQPRVIWFGFHEEPMLTRLYQAIDKALVEFGFEPEQKKFALHLTLGRIKNLTEKQELDNYLHYRQQPFDEKFDAVSFQLFKSILKQNGPEYLVIKEFRLEGK